MKTIDHRPALRPLDNSAPPEVYFLNPKTPSKPIKTFVYKVLWASTSLVIRVTAPNEATAWLRASRRKDTKGSWSITLIREEDSHGNAV